MTDPHAPHPQPLRRVSPHVYWLPPDPAPTGRCWERWCGTRATLLVDAGNSPAHAGLMLEKLPGALDLRPTWY